MDSSKLYTIQCNRIRFLCGSIRKSIHFSVGHSKKMVLRAIYVCSLRIFHGTSRLVFVLLLKCNILSSLLLIQRVIQCCTIQCSCVGESSDCKEISFLENHHRVLLFELNMIYVRLTHWCDILYECLLLEKL